MSTWLSAWRKQDDHGVPVMELSVVEGEDAGSQFTVEGDAVLVGRGRPESGRVDAIRLQDKSVSRKQAWIRRDAEGVRIEHVPTAANPTLLNGEEVVRAPLAEGDRVEMGRVVAYVRARTGMNLSGLTEVIEDAARETTLTGVRPLRSPTEPTLPRGVASSAGLAEEVTVSGQGVQDDRTDLRPLAVEIGDLVVEEGVQDFVGRRFPIRLGSTSIGRGEQCDVSIPERGVSRLHAEIEIAGRALELIHRSDTNPTVVNGLPVVGRVALEDGDEIRLADRVILRLRLAAKARPTSPGAGSALSRRMEDKIDLDREIEEFSVRGSFLDVDVVESRRMKGSGEKAEHIIVSFDRFRGFVTLLCEEFDGQVLNSNGDELMCFFESPVQALLAGSALLERLDAFNEESNLLDRPFRFRLGVHSGVSLVDLAAGISYSDVLDTAGHIQKQAEPNTMLVSESTIEGVDGDIPATIVGELPGDGTRLYRIDRFLTPDDLGPAGAEGD